MRANKRILLLVLTFFFFCSYVISAQVNAPKAMSSAAPLEKEDFLAAPTTDNDETSESVVVGQKVASSFRQNLGKAFKGGHHVLQVSSLSNSASFSRHIMCKDFDFSWNPIDPTTIFRPSDVKVTCLTTVTINETIEFRWYYRSDTSETWVSCFNWSTAATFPGEYHEYHFAGYLQITGYWPGSNYPRAYKVEVHLDGSLSSAFSEFFEVTNGGVNSPRMCKDIDENGHPVNMTSRFTIGNDTKAHHYLRFDKVAYFNEELDCCHNFTTVWIQPNGSAYETYSANFTDYKDTDATRNYWEYNSTLDDYITLNSSTSIGNWTVEVYLDRYYLNNTWEQYGPITTTPFIVGNETVADWTFMVYLDADNNLEEAGIDIFEKMASVGSTPQVNIVVQMDRAHGFNEEYGDWRDCRRFYVAQNTTPASAPLWGREVDMGDPGELKDFINWTITDYPANYYFLVLWNHGAGHMGLCFDNGTYPLPIEYLSLPELSQALSGLPVIMDVVLLDACSMSMIEIAYQIKDYANVLVGPEGLGYSPAPYDDYLLNLTSNSSTSPKEFAMEVVTDYMEWCNGAPIADIPNATMSATDLTKITSLTATIDDFALKLRDNETPYMALMLETHERIILARNLTEGYLGPFACETGYYVDLYHFAQLINQSVADEELRNISYQVMTALESTLIIEANKARPDSHGLSVFFPDEKAKYEDYKNAYEEITFTEDTLWDEFLNYHLSGHILTIKTPYTDISVKVDEQSYVTDAYGKIRVFVEPGSYTINVTSLIQIGPSSREVFAQWNDNDTSNPRILLVDSTLTLEVEYESQYYVTIAQSGSAVSLNASIDMLSLELPSSFWWTEGSIHNVSVPLAVSGDSGTRYTFTQWNDTETELSRTITISGPATHTAYYETQYEVTFSESSVGTDFTGTVLTVDVTEYNSTDLPRSFWWTNGSTHTFTFKSPLIVASNAKQYAWSSTSGLSPLRTDSITVSTAGDITGNYKIQYYLTIHIDPSGISPLPDVSPPGPWYDNGTLVNCTAQKISGRVFDCWTIDGATWDPGVDTVTVTMDRPHEATAHYVREPTWWEILFSLESLNLIIAVLGLVVTVALLAVAWVRTRRRRAVVKALLNKIDKVYSKFKTKPQECEKELSKWKEKMFEDLTEGKISEETYDLVNKKIDRYMEELRKE